MEKGRILFTDLDGTLLSDDNQISKKNHGAIEDTLKKGSFVAAATGRPLESAKAVAKKLGLIGRGCYLIAFNGSILYDCFEEKILYEQTIPIAIVKKMLNEAEKAGIYMQTYDKTAILAKAHTKELDYYAKRTGMAYRIQPDLAESLREEPYKALLIDLESRKKLEDFQTRNNAWTKEKLNSFFSCKEYLEYCPVGVDKGAAVLQLCRILGISPEQAVAVGDESNDISMIKEAGIGVAVKNAVSAAKEAADYITQNDNNHDAVAEVIEKFM